MSAAQLGRKASEAYSAAAALANPFTRRVAEAIANATNKDPKSSSSRGRKNNGGSGDDNDDGTRCTDPAPFGFLDNMCGPMLRNFNADLGGSNDADDITETNRSSSRGRDRRGRSRRDGGPRRPTSSYDYDDETNATDITGSYEDDDETYDDESRRKSSRRGRDRKPRSPADSPSEMTGAYSEFDDDTTQGDTITDASSAYYDHKKESSKKSKKKGDDSTAVTKESGKLITQPLASGFAKRCYFTKAGIGRTTQHYEGLTLTGNTVLMLAAAMKLKGCPTICDEDLRRVEQTYPNQFSRLPDELLLSSGWRRISKYCHFSSKPLPDGVPFFHSRKRCHPNGGFFFLLCSAVGMTRLMDVEPLNRDALAVLQTDFPMTCEKAPKFLIEEPNEWTLVNKFCFFSGGPINCEEDVYYRAELGGTEIYMLAFLSPSLSPEELYRLKPPSASKAQKQAQGENEEEEDTGPLKSVAAVEEVESVYDLTERDFDDLKLYHLGPCRALPPYLLHPEAWTKVLPPHFVAAREEAMRIAQDYESQFPPAAGVGQQQGALPVAPPGPEEGGMAAGSPGSGYVELGGATGRPTPSSRGGASVGMPPLGPGGFPPQYPVMPPMQDPNAPYYPPQGVPVDQAGFPPVDQAGFPQQQQPYGAPPAPMDSEMNYYYGPSPGGGPAGAQYPQQMPYDATGGPPPPQYDQYGNALPPQHMMIDPHWRDVQEEGAFGRLGGGDQPDDEAIATRGGTYGGPGEMQHPMGAGPGELMMDPNMNMEDPYNHHQVDPPVDDASRGADAKSVASGTSSLMGGAQNRLMQNRMKKMKEKSQRPDLSTKLNPMPTPGGGTADDSTWDDTRTEGESSYGTSLVSGSSYTDTTNPNERNSRRALILQMAKARMKNVKESGKNAKGEEVGQGGSAHNTSLDAPQDEMVDEMAGLELD